MNETSLLDELASMRAELASLRAEVAHLKGTAATDGPDADADGATEPVPELAVTSRRRLFALAGGAAATAVVAATVGASRPAAATNGDPLVIANNTGSTAGVKVISTYLNYEVSSGNPDDKNLFVVGDATVAAFNPPNPAAISGHAAKHVDIGVLGTATRSTGTGVRAIATSTDFASTALHATSVGGIAMVAASQNASDLRLNGTGRLVLGQHIASGPPTSGNYFQGELVRDANSDLFFSRTSGLSTQWRKVVFEDALPAAATLPPQLHIIEPTRVYDSRLPGFGDRISDGGSRSVSVANGIDINSGAVTVADVVPAGATAIQFTFTIDAAQNNGFLAVTPGDAATFKASTINWSPTTPNIASGSLCKLDANRTVKVFAGGGGSTHFLIDVTGYYL